MPSRKVSPELRTEYQSRRCLVGEGACVGGETIQPLPDQGREQHCKKSIQDGHHPEDFGEPFHVESGYCVLCGYPACSNRLEGERAQCSANGGSSEGKLLYWEDSAICSRCENAEDCAAAMAARKGHCPQHLKPGPHPREHGWPYHPDSLHCKTCSLEQIRSCDLTSRLSPCDDNEGATAD